MLSAIIIRAAAGDTNTLKFLFGRYSAPTAKVVYKGDKKFEIGEGAEKAPGAGEVCCCSTRHS